MPPGANANKLSPFSSTKLRYIRLMHTSQVLLDMATIFFSIVDTLLVFDIDDGMTYTRVCKDPIDEFIADSGTVSDSKWTQWWEQAVPEVESVG